MADERDNEQTPSRRTDALLPSFDFFTYLFRFSGAIAAGIVVFVVLALGIRLFAEIQLEIVTFRFPELPVGGATTPSPRVDVLIPRLVARSGPSVARTPQAPFATFTELFSGVGWIDTNATTLWHDRTTQSITFAPTYETRDLTTLHGIRVHHITKGDAAWLLADAQGTLYALPVSGTIAQPVTIAGGGYAVTAIEYLPSITAWLVVRATDDAGEIWKVDASYIAERLATFSVRGPSTLACINTQCVLKNGDALAKFIANVPAPSLHAVTLPAEIAAPKTLGRVGPYWLVSAGSETREATYQFDGTNFLALASAVITSDYPGTLSFGGTPDDWLAVYGAYEGAGLRFDSIPPTRPGSDISSLFNIRVMEFAGFPAGIVSIDHAHYIFANDRSLPKFLKIENGAANDLTDDLKLGTADYAVLAAGPGPNEVAIASAGQNGTAIRIFRNTGFRTPANPQIVSKKLNTQSQTQEVAAAEIARAEGANLEYISFSLSADGGRTWKSVRPGELTSFPAGSGRSDLRWRAVFRTPSDSYVSPSLSEIQIRYYYES